MSLALKSDTVELKQSGTKPYNPESDSSATESSDEEINGQDPVEKKIIEELPPAENFPSPPEVTLLPACLHAETDDDIAGDYAAPKHPVTGRKLADEINPTATVIPEKELEASLVALNYNIDEKERKRENCNLGFKEKLGKTSIKKNVNIDCNGSYNEEPSNPSCQKDLPTIKGIFPGASRGTTAPVSNVAEVEQKLLPLLELQSGYEDTTSTTELSALGNERNGGMKYPQKASKDGNSAIRIASQSDLPLKFNPALDIQISAQSSNEEVRSNLEMYFMQQLKKVKLIDVHRKDWRNFADQVFHSFSVQESCPAPTLSENCDQQKIYYFLHGFVVHMEQCFERFICLTGEEIYEECVKFKTYPTLPPQLTSFLKQKLQDFAEEYMYRNEIIKEKEEQGALNMVNISRDMYSRIVKAQLGNSYLDERAMKNLLDSCYAAIEKNFLVACCFKHKEWEDKFKSSLQEAISGEKDRLRKANEENHVFLRSYLEGINRDCQSLYRKTVIERIKLEENLDMQLFNAIDKKSVAKVEAHFVTRTQSEVFGQHEGIIDEEKKNMLQIIVNLSNKHRHDINEKTQKVQLPPPQNPTRNTAIASLPETQIVSRSTVTNVPGSKRSTELTYDLLQDFMVIHLALREFTVGGFHEGSTELFQLLTDDIWSYLAKEGLYMKSKDLNANKDSFLGAFIGKSIHTHYEVIVDTVTQCFHLKDFMAFLISRIIKSVRSSIGRQPNRCIICLPQCLNHLQRDAIKDGCSVGGFETTDVISDTNAIALAYVRHYSMPFPTKLLAANFSDAPCDVAWFSIQHAGAVTCEAISGNVFLRGAGWISSGCSAIRNLVFRSNEMEKSIKEILSRESSSDHAQVFVICGYASEHEKILSKHYHHLLDLKKECDLDCPLQGAAEVAHLINVIEGNPYIDTPEYISMLANLKKNILSHVTRDSTSSNNNPCTRF